MPPLDRDTRAARRHRLACPGPLMREWCRDLYGDSPGSAPVRAPSARWGLRATPWRGRMTRH